VSESEAVSEFNEKAPDEGIGYAVNPATANLRAFIDAAVAPT
jgi:hypothetical protein